MVYCQRSHTYASFCQEFYPVSLLTSLDQKDICQQQQQEKYYRHAVSEQQQQQQ